MTTENEELAKRVENGDKRLLGMVCDALKIAFSDPNEEKIDKALNGSVDSALDLVDVLLPGWWWVKPANNYGTGLHRIELYGPMNYAISTSETPSRAIVSALLRALDKENDE